MSAGENRLVWESTGKVNYCMLENKYRYIQTHYKSTQWIQSHTVPFFTYMKDIIYDLEIHPLDGDFLDRLICMSVNESDWTRKHQTLSSSLFKYQFEDNIPSCLQHICALLSTYSSLQQLVTLKHRVWQNMRNITVEYGCE